MVYVEDMTNEDLARCYRVLKRVLMVWGDADCLVACEDIIQLMNALEEELT